MQLRKSKFLTGKNYAVTLVAFLCASSPSYSQEGEEQSIAEQQASQIKSIIVDMNESAKTVVDTVTSEPQKAIDGGCLAGIQGIDLSAMSVDPTDIWGAVYDRIKSEILGVACSAGTAWANEQTARLDLSLQTPIGSVELGQGNSISDWQSVQTTDVELSNDEVAASVSTDTLGNIPGIPTNAPVKRVQTGERNTESNAKEYEEKMEESFNLKQIWGNEDDEGE